MVFKEDQMTSSKETKKTKILVLGSEGQLGSSLLKTLGKNFIVEGINKKKFNFLEPKNFSNLLKKDEIKYVINAAAYTNVEQAEIEVDFAKQINGEALKFIAQACNEKKIKLWSSVGSRATFGLISLDTQIPYLS